MSLLLVTFGVVSFVKLPLREYPNIDAPIISINTNYPGASANIVETRITQLLEDRISGVEGLRTIESKSTDGRSKITIEFDIQRDIDDAANDIRDRISRVLANLPTEADLPEVEKANSDDDVIIWFNFVGTHMSVMELTDYAKRYLQNSFSAVDGVARVRLGGAKEQAMRIWLNRQQLAARNLTIEDVENALRTENVELPAGQLQSLQRDFTLRVSRAYNSAEDFGNLVLSRGQDNYLVRLKDVAQIEIAAIEERGFFRGNGQSMIGIGIIKQSTANTLAVARQAKQKMYELNANLPEELSLTESFDSSVFIERAINEVYKTLLIAIGLVVLVIYLFLGSIRLTLIPAITVPVALTATFILVAYLGFTINLLTLLALVLAIGLVVDDTIVVLENIYRRVELGEPSLVAAYRGTNQVSFAVIATTLVLVSVFLPITFLEGDVGRLFSEFAITMAAAVGFSSFIALTLTAMLASKLLKKQHNKTWLTQGIDYFFKQVTTYYISSLQIIFKYPMALGLGFICILVATVWLFIQVPKAFTPQEDRGVIFLIIDGPQGSSYEYMVPYLDKIEQRLAKFVDSKEFERLLIRSPRGLANTQAYNNGIAIIVLNDWQSRKPIWHYIQEIRNLTADLSGVTVFPIARQALTRSNKKPVQFVLGANSYTDLVNWRDILLEKAAANKNLVGLDSDYKETKPQLMINILPNRAADLGVSIRNINRTLETMLGSKRVTTFIERGEEYEVILEGDQSLQQSLLDIKNIYVRSERTQALIPLSNLVTISELADVASLNRYNRLRSITLDANLAPGYSLGEALTYLEDLANKVLPDSVRIDYKGESLSLKTSQNTIYFIFGLALVVVYLVMAGQFESFIHPFTIMLTVPLAIFGALLGLWLTEQSINIYSQIGMIMLIGLATKNGILIVEFINQLRDEGQAFESAILNAAATRLRPIIMTSLTTIMGSVPLILSSGAGAETRFVIGIVIFSGVLITTFLTLYLVPSIYRYVAKNTGSPKQISQQLEQQLQQYDSKN
jgi:multidrug efflux pump